MVKVITRFTVPPLKRLCKNVAVYCRVSTLQEIQYNSLEAQRSYYTKYIASHPEWRLIEIYADQVSGRSNKKMGDFQRMMTDCYAGKIDLILVKSISRMGRNTVDLLEVCGELRNLGIEAFFEVEKLYASNPKAIRMLTIFASLYQNESETKSFAITWGHRVRFLNGSSGMANRVCYGYGHNELGELVPIQKEAAVVCMIYSWHSQEWSLRIISAEVQQRNIPSPRGNTKWGIETIRKILQNEKYRGNVLLQKNFVANFFTGCQSKNHGEYEQYLLCDHHEAIIQFETSNTNKYGL